MTLTCKELSCGYVYKKNISSVLNKVSLNLNQGEFVCLAGPNGSGKSTLLSVLAGLAGNKGDCLRINGALEEAAVVCGNNNQPVKEMSRVEAAKKIAFMTQSENPAWDATVLETILTGRFAHSGSAYTEEDFRIARECAECLNIENLSERSILTLSGGEFQKVRLARSLAQKPVFLLLDEPCSGLDFSSEPELLETLKNISHLQNIGILATIHNLNLAVRFADKLMLLPPGQPSIFGNTAEVFTRKNLSKTYSKEFQIYIHPLLEIPQIL